MTLDRVPRGVVAAGALVALSACGERATPNGADSGIDTAALSQAAADAPADWVGELGQLLLVPSDSANAAVVIFPDFPSPRLVASAPITLVSTSGDTTLTRGQLVATESEQCGGAPLVQFADTIAKPWSIGLLRRTATTLRMDSIEALPAADSAELAGDLARLGSSLPQNDQSRFSGLPYTVLGAHRIEEDNRTSVVGHLVRRLPQEASPLEEHVLVIAERARTPRSPWSSAYSQRSEGSEDTAEHFTILAAVRAGDRTLLILARDQLERTRYEVLERPANGQWRTRWSRTLVC